MEKAVGNYVAESIDYAGRLEQLLWLYPHPTRWPEPGKEAQAAWKGTEIEKASDGEVNKQYFSKLKNGEIEKPSFEKLYAISKIMSFPFELWFAPMEQWSKIRARMAPEKYVMPEDYAVNLGEVYKRTRRSQRNFAGLPPSHVEIAAKTGYRIMEDELERLEDGTDTDLEVGQLLALSEAMNLAFNVWFSDHNKLPYINEDVVEALRDQRKYRLLQLSADLKEEQFVTLLVLAEHFTKENSAPPKYRPPSIAFDLPLDEPEPDSRPYVRRLLGWIRGEGGPKAR